MIKINQNTRNLRVIFGKKTVGMELMYSEPINAAAVNLTSLEVPGDVESNKPESGEVMLQFNTIEGVDHLISMLEECKKIMAQPKSTES